MDKHDFNVLSQGQERTRELSMPALMPKVFIWLTLALAITALTAFVVASNPALLNMIFGSKIAFWGIIIAEFALVIYVSSRLDKMSLTTATALFVLYSVLNGATLSLIFIAFSLTSLTKVFLITAGTFAVMAIIGLTTKKDLSSIGSICFMALIGLIIASVVNLFMRSGTLDFIISGVGVLVFVGLTAYDTRKIKASLQEVDNQSETAGKIALMGAFSLYLDFINLFLYLLRFFGRRD